MDVTDRTTEQPDPPPEPAETGQRLTPADVAVDAPYAVIDPGTEQWPPIVDPALLIPALWRRFAELAERVQTALIALEAAVDEIHAIETTLGVNPHDGHVDVAARLDAIEARLDGATVATFAATPDRPQKPGR